MNKVVLTLCAFVAFLLISFALWLAVRSINYRFGYESMVKDTITKIVKAECMK